MSTSDINVPIQKQLLTLRIHGAHHREQAQSLFKWIFPLCPIPRTKVQCLDAIQRFIDVGYIDTMWTTMRDSTWDPPAWKVCTAYDCEYWVHLHKSPQVIPILDAAAASECTLPILTHGEDHSVYGPIHGKCQLLPDILREQQGVLTPCQALALVDLYTRLDNAGILLQDHSPNHFAQVRGKWCLTTFSHAKQCTGATSNRDCLRWMLYDPLQGLRSQMKHVPPSFLEYYRHTQ
jgi:hypothetical protein